MIRKDYRRKRSSYNIIQRLCIRRVYFKLIRLGLFFVPFGFFNIFYETCISMGCIDHKQFKIMRTRNSCWAHGR